MDKEKLIAIISKNINIGGLFADALDELLEPALKKIVADTENTFDDALMAVYPMLSEQIKLMVAEEIKKLVDGMMEVEPTGEEA